MKAGIFTVLIAGAILVGFTSNVKAKSDSNNSVTSINITDTAKVKKAKSMIKSKMVKDTARMKMAKSKIKAKKDSVKKM